MKIFLRLLNNFFITLFFALISAQPAYADTFTLSGNVSDSTGTDIEGATIDIIDTNTNFASTTTDSAGNYTTVINGARYNIQVTPPAGSSFSSVIILGQTISANTVLNFILTPATGFGTLKGQIFDTEGIPLGNQKIQFGNSVVTSDSSGNYSLQVPLGTDNLSVYVPLSNSGSNPLSANAPQVYMIQTSLHVTQDTILDITLPAKRVNVHVQDQSGNPVSGINLSSLPAGLDAQTFTSRGNLDIGGGITNANGGSFYGLGDLPQPQTDSFGNATLWLFPNNVTDYPGLYSITATPSNESNYQLTTLSNITITEETNLTITMLQAPQQVTLYGKIKDALGNPLINQQVKISNSNTSLTVDTDAGGNYSFQTPIGAYTLKISVPFSTFRANPFSVSAPQVYVVEAGVSLSEDRELNITLPAKKVDIHVQDQLGNPVGGVGITTEPAGLDAQTYTSRGNLEIGDGIADASGGSLYGQSDLPEPQTDSSGNVTIWLFPNNVTDYPGRYNFIASAPSGSNYQTTSLSDITISGDTTLSITLEQQPITLTGHVYDSFNNALPNQKITISNSITSTTVTTDSTGSYSFQTQVGTYNFKIFVPLSTSQSNAFSVNAPQVYVIESGLTLSEDTELNITLPAKKILLHIQDQMGDPISGVKIMTSPVGFDAQTYTSRGNLNIGGGITNASGGSFYGQSDLPQPQTDSSGNVTLWLFPNNVIDYPGLYSITAIPPSGSIYSPFTLSNITVVNDMTEVVSLQFNHATPVTAVTLTPDPNGEGAYQEPTTVTLSAIAAEGYTVANTYYTVDGGSQQTYTSPFTVSGNGSHSIEYWSIDNSGVTESKKTESFLIATPTNTPTPTPTPAPRQLTSLSPANVWMSKALFDFGLRLDVLVEAYRDNVLVSSGQATSVTVGTILGTMTQLTIPFNSFQATDFPQGTELKVKVSTRNACTGSLRNNGTAKLWYNDAQANSRFDATIGGTHNNYYLRNNFILSQAVGSGPRQQSTVSAGNRCSAFKAFGTWKITP